MYLLVQKSAAGKGHKLINHRGLFNAQCKTEYSKNHIVGSLNTKHAIFYTPTIHYFGITEYCFEQIHKLSRGGREKETHPGKYLHEENIKLFLLKREGAVCLLTDRQSVFVYTNTAQLKTKYTCNYSCELYSITQTDEVPFGRKPEESYDRRRSISVDSFSVFSLVREA
jgi:hypothetical protein